MMMASIWLDSTAVNVLKRFLIILLLSQGCNGVYEKGDGDFYEDGLNWKPDSDIYEIVDNLKLDLNDASENDSEVMLELPSSICVVAEANTDVLIEIVPPHPRPDIPLTFNVTSFHGHTNVKLVLCGPSGQIIPEGPQVFPGSPNLWIWTSEPLKTGIYQAQFSADPNDTVYKTFRFTVEENSFDEDGDGYESKASGGNDCNDENYEIHPEAKEICSDGIDQNCDGTDEACSFCSPPSENIIEHGEFEEGMEDLAPVGWQVRNPDMPYSCPGDPQSHVFPGEPPPGCGGHSLVIDSGGIQWDCYAIQTVSPYFSIEAGHTYRISAVVKSSGNSINPAAWFIIGVQWVDAGDRFFGDEKNPRTTSAEENDFDWKLMEFDLIAPPGATRILVWLTAHYPGRVYYDNISVVRVD